MNLIFNIQFQQFINLLLLLFVAKFNNSLQTSFSFIFLLSIYALILEATINYLKCNKIYIPISSVITIFGIVLMVGWLKWYIPFVIATFAILQKRFLVLQNRHIFNPSNFAIILALLIFYPQALPIVGEIGFRGYFIIFLILALSTLILIRVNRFAITISFLLFFTILEYLFVGKSDPYWNFDEFITKFYSTSFILYSTFMITDPLTTPNKISLQIAFAFLVALIASILDYFIGVRVWNLFLALFLTSAIISFKKQEFAKSVALILVAVAIVAIIMVKKPLYFSM